MACYVLTSVGIHVSVEATLRICVRNLKVNSAGSTDVKGLYESVETASRSMIFMPIFLKIDKGVRATLRFCFSNLNVSNVGTSYGKAV
jgi:hypothetical protein